MTNSSPRDFTIKAVVSLPQITFQPYTPTKTSLLFAVKKKKGEVEAWDGAWREATREYGKLRAAEIVALLLANDRIRNGLIDVANRAEVEWYPAVNLLTASTLPAAMRKVITAACEDGSSLKKKFAKLLEDFDNFTTEKRIASLNGMEEKAARATIARLLRDRVPADADKFTFFDLLEIAYDDLLAAAELNHNEDPKGQSYCNAWWCFAEVSSRKEFNNTIFFAEAEHVGYKRTTRHPEGIDRPNDLFATDADGNILIDVENPSKILDHLRSRNLFAHANKS